MIHPNPAQHYQRQKVLISGKITLILTLTLILANLADRQVTFDKEAIQYVMVTNGAIQYGPYLFSVMTPRNLQNLRISEFTAATFDEASERR